MAGEADFFFFFFDTEEPRRGRYFSFVESIEEMGGGYVAVHLDSVAQDAVNLDQDFADDADDALGFLRVVSTHKRLAKFAGLGRRLAPGDWLEVEVDDRAEGPRVWSLQLRDNRYVGNVDGDPRPSRTRLASLRRLGREPDSRPLKSLGAAAPSKAAKGAKLKKRYDLSTWDCVVGSDDASAWLNGALGTQFEAATPVAIDVGQASCNVLAKLKQLGALYFDAGEPIWLHVLTKPDPLTLPDALAVVLSHWDSDHYALGRHHGSFSTARWIAPAQSVGPNAHSFAKWLHAAGRLDLINQATAPWHGMGIELLRCVGNSLNGSGIAACLHSAKGPILFSGDANYDEIPVPSALRFAAVQMPHHGGRLPPSCPIPPCAGERGIAVASFGKGNRYGHPDLVTLRRYRAKWDVRMTADWKRVGRGDKAYL